MKISLVQQGKTAYADHGDRGALWGPHLALLCLSWATCSVVFVRESDSQRTAPAAGQGRGSRAVSRPGPRCELTIPSAVVSRLWFTVPQRKVEGSLELFFFDVLPLLSSGEKLKFVQNPKAIASVAGTR